MKFIKHTIIAASLLASGMANAQVKVGDNPTTINSNSVLEIESTTKGVLLPRVALTETTNASPLGAHVAGMFVYNTASANDVTPGTYYNNGSAWVRADGELGWLVNGNTGTTAGTNFLGTIDNVDLQVKTNSTLVYTVEADGDILFEGYDATTPTDPSLANGIINDGGYMQFKDVLGGDKATIYGYDDGLALSAFSYANSKVMYDNATTGQNRSPEIFIRQNNAGLVDMKNGSAVGIGIDEPTAMLHVGGGQRGVNANNLGKVWNFRVTGAGGGANNTGALIDDGGFLEFANAGTASLDPLQNTSVYASIFKKNNSLVISHNKYENHFLAVNPATETILIQNERTVFNQTTGIVLPRGTTGERNTSEIGTLRYNTTTNKVEVYTNTGWVDLH